MRKLWLRSTNRVNYMHCSVGETVARCLHHVRKSKAVEVHPKINHMKRRKTKPKMKVLTVKMLWTRKSKTARSTDIASDQ